jgi:hypothetical protein
MELDWSVLLIRVTLAPLDRYIIFQLASLCLIFSTIPSQMDLALKQAPGGRPRYFKGKEDVHNPRYQLFPKAICMRHVRDMSIRKYKDFILLHTTRNYKDKMFIKLNYGKKE